MKNKVKALISYFKKGVYLIFANKQTLAIDALLRRSLYAKLFYAGVLLFVISILSVFLFKSVAFSLVPVVVSIAAAAYMTINERDNENGALKFVYGVCVAKEKVDNFSGKLSRNRRVYEYRLLCENDAGNEYSIYLRRTEMNGFVVGGMYYLCFKPQNGEALTNSTLVCSIEVQNSADIIESEALPNIEERDADFLFIGDEDEDLMEFIQSQGYEDLSQNEQGGKT